MPLPTRNLGEKKEEFIQRCLGDDVMKAEYPDIKQRLAVCNQQANKPVK